MTSLQLVQPKSTDDTCNKEETTFVKRFYGQAEHKNVGIISSLLKRKGRKIGLSEECKAPCRKLEAYKCSMDRLHQALMYILVENPTLSSQLGTNETTKKPEIDRSYANAAEFIKTFDKIQRQGRKGDYESLDTTISSLQKIHVEYERYVKKQLNILKPMIKFIGDDYWEYCRLRKVYWEALELFDNALTAQNKERTEEAEKATQSAQLVRNEAKQKMMDFVQKIGTDDKLKHAESVLKFFEEELAWHNQIVEILSNVETKEHQPTSGISKVK